MSLTSLRRSSLVDQVIAQLRQQITSGTWPVGHRIPTEPELVDTLGVARNTVREAVRALAHNGLLDIRQGSGTYVMAAGELAGVLHRRFAEAEPLHIAELRSALECSAARLAARRRTEEDLTQLETLLARREEAWAGRSAEPFVTADISLHMAVVAASHNDVLIELYVDLGQLAAEQLRANGSTVPRRGMRLDHSRLIEAIRREDADAAAAEAAAHSFACLGRHHPADHG